MIDLSKSAKDNFFILLEDANNDVRMLRNNFKRKIKFYNRTSRGKEKLRTRSGKSFAHRLAMYKKMDRLAFKYSIGDDLNALTLIKQLN